MRSIKRETDVWATSTHALHEVPACDDPEGQLEPFHKFGTLLGSVGHKVKIHKITSATVKERGDIEIKDYRSWR